ncbi:hypothetical protein CAPTEDRAFT_177732 [Capitella teleta]|uniref:SWIRM domain-containing protein n=1 Tax=Capitella teleta TaxID=283909 RepID=R7THZ1_CAPTE|nr:hypothetical protein CAPTEDRAFT_177732 [Capitella teleta]|eukprot:ELT93319.1 hypothetical protein CAPTEDRAFT_177732 [Capitella teleta]
MKVQESSEFYFICSFSCEYRTSNRWYHWSSGEHYCNKCFEAIYRRDLELVAEMEAWQKQWDLFAGCQGKLRLFIGDRILPFWLRCNSCQKWRPLDRKVVLTPENISSFQCGQLTPHSHPAMMVKRIGDKNWLSTLTYPPFLISSPAAPFLRDYLADQVGLSPSSADPDVTLTSGKSTLQHLFIYLFICLFIFSLKVLNPFSVTGQYPRSFNPQAMTAEEEEVFSNLASFQCIYLALRNLVLSMWAQNCKELLTAEKCAYHVICHGLVRICLVKELPKIIKYLTTRGFINTGVVQDIPTGGLFPQELNQKNIIVIGAGMAGLTAARQLHNWGAKVMVVEASPRIGGRIDDSRDLGMCIGKGAQILNSSTNNPLLILLKQTGARTVPLDERCPLFTTRGQVVDEEEDHLIEAHFNSLLERVSKWQEKNPENDCSLLHKIQKMHKNSAVGKVFTEEHEKLLAFYMSNLEYACGCSLSDLSALHWDHTERLLQFNGPSCFVTQGFGSVLEQLAEGLNIRCDHQVDEIDYTGDKIKVSFTGGKFYDADQIIVTVPLRVLQTENIAFNPSLPETKYDAIQNLGAGIIEKVALKFPCRFWPSTCQTFGCVPEKTEERGMFNVFYDVSKCDDVEVGHVLLTYLTGHAVDVVKNLTDVEIVQRCIGTLQKMFPKEVVPDPISSFVSHWRDNNHVGMAFSYVPTGSSSDLYDSVKESLEGRVLFAGEATSQQFPQSVTGAYLSGLRAAENIFGKR